MKKVIMILTTVVLMVSVSVSAGPVSRDYIQGYLDGSNHRLKDTNYSVDADIVKALELAVKHIERMRPKAESDFGSLTSTADITGIVTWEDGSVTVGEWKTPIPADLKRDEAEEVINKAEQEMKKAKRKLEEAKEKADKLKIEADQIEQCEKDLEFIKSVLEGLR